MSQEVMNLVLGVAGGLILLLLAGLTFFVARLIEKVEVMGNNFPAYTAKVDGVATQVTEVKAEVSRIAGDFKEVSALRERVAVLEYINRDTK